MRYLFICGCGHSGTSLMLSIFSSAEGVLACTDETMLLLKHSTKEVKRALASLAGDRSCSIVVEKTPRHVYALDKIIADPECDALVMVRNPIDVVASLKKRGANIHQAIKRYRMDNEQWMSRAGTGGFTVVRYETLVMEPATLLIELSKQFSVDLIQADERRRESDVLFFQSAGATEARETDGIGVANHLALRNHQMREEIKDMNGQWASRLDRKELETIKHELNDYICELGYDECLSYSLA